MIPTYLPAAFRIKRYSTCRIPTSFFMKDFLLTVVIGGIIAIPLAYLIMNQWLNNYAYRIAITPMPFLITINLLIMLTAILIGIQTIKAALANPVKSLRVD